MPEQPADTAKLTLPGASPPNPSRALTECHFSRAQFGFFVGTHPGDASRPLTSRLPHARTDGRVIDLPFLKDATGASFLDVRKLYPTTQICTYDPGFNSTASCASAITFIDGDKGRLLYRGYPIEDLAEHGDMADCAHLLIRGVLPTRKQRREFQREVRAHRLVHEHLIRFFHGFNHDAHPMAILVSVVGALSAFYNDDHDYTDPATRDLAGMRCVGKMPTLAAYAYKTAHGQPIVYPRDDLVSFFLLPYGQRGHRVAQPRRVHGLTSCLLYRTWRVTSCI